MRKKAEEEEENGRRKEKNRSLIFSLSTFPSHLRIHCQGPGDAAGVLGRRKGEAGLAVFFFKSKKGGREEVGVEVFWSDNDGQRFVD